MDKMPSRQEVSRIFELVAATTHGWSDRDLAGMMSHQLSSPIVFDPEAVADGGIEMIVRGNEPTIKTFGDLLSNPTPPVRLLELLKKFAKSCANDPSDQRLPPKIATVLYYASIALARVRCHERITKMGDEEILAGVEWAIDLPWLPHGLRLIFDECRAALVGKSG